MKNILEIKNVDKVFKKFKALDNVTFNITDGGIHGLIGPNGSGKTTLIKMIIGSFKLSAGEILIGGHKAGTVKANAQIGYIPEKPVFPKSMTAFTFLYTMAQLHGIKQSESKRLANELLEKNGLGKFKDKKPVDFSSGMQKKLLLAQAVISKPKLLILDEPAANLDPKARKDLFNNLLQLNKELGTTILISSHILLELEKIIDECTFIYYSKMLWSKKIEKGSKSSKVFLSTSNNEKFVEVLKTKKVRAKLIDFATEIEASENKDMTVTKMISLAKRHKIEVYSFKRNNLQAMYDKLVEKQGGERDL